MALSSNNENESRCTNEMELSSKNKMPWKRDSNTKLQQFDDGHIPETFRYESIPSQILIQKNMEETKQDQTQDCLSVFPNILPTYLTDEIYRTTTKNRHERSWGTYVTIEEIHELSKILSPYKDQKDASIIESFLQSESSNGDDNHHDKEEQYRHHLAKVVMFHYLYQTLKSVTHNISKDLSSNKIHGVAIWALSSKINDEVQYHIDYAEFIRYQHNIIYPPLYAGTIQCSPLNITSQKSKGKNTLNQNYWNKGGIMKGGDFAVNIQGLKHYEKHGYKGKKSQDPFGGYTYDSSFQYSPLQFTSSSSCNHHDILNSDTFRNKTNNRPHDNANNSDLWINIPYQYNQGIFHTGTYPHLSTPIKSITIPSLSSSPSSSTNSEDVTPHSHPPKIHRVIMGINFFGWDVGPMVQEAPEHSMIFRKKVKRMQAISRTTTKQTKTSDTDNVGSTTTNHTYGLKLDQIRKNKALTKLLVVAKREKVKLAYQEEKRHIWKQLQKILMEERKISIVSFMDRLSCDSNNSATNTPATCNINSCGTTIIPREADVLVHIHNWIKSGDLEKIGVSVQCEPEIVNEMFDDHGIILPSCILIMDYKH